MRPTKVIYFLRLPDLFTSRWLPGPTQLTYFWKSVTATGNGISISGSTKPATRSRASRRQVLILSLNIMVTLKLACLSLNGCDPFAEFVNLSKTLIIF